MSGRGGEEGSGTCIVERGGGRRRKKKNTSAASSHPPRREKKAGTCWGRGTDAAASPAPGQPDLRHRAAGMGRTRPSYLRLRRSPSPSRRFMGASALPTAAASARNDPGMLRRRRRRCVGRANAVPRPPPPHPSSKSRQAPPPALAGGGPIRAGPESTSKSRQAPPPALAGDGPDRGRPLGRRARWVSWVHAGRLSGRRQRRPLAEAAVGGGEGEGRRGGEWQDSSGMPAGACTAAAPPIPRPPLLRRPRRPPTLFLPLRAFAGGTCP